MLKQYQYEPQESSICYHTAVACCCFLFKLWCSNFPLRQMFVAVRSMLTLVQLFPVSNTAFIFKTYSSLRRCAWPK